MTGSDLANYVAKQIVLVCVVAALVLSSVWDAAIYIVKHIRVEWVQ